MSGSTRYCANCGALLQAATGFCVKCGVAQTGPAAATGDRPAVATGTPSHVGRYIVFGIAAIVLAFGAWIFWEAQTPVPQFDQARYDEAAKQAVQKELQEALNAPEQVSKLELNGGKLTRLPEDFVKLQNLRELAIHDNGTLDFASALALLAKIPSLERLDLAETDLQALPGEIGGLANLKELLLWHNELKTLPSEIGRLEKLEWVNLAQNPIETLPVEMSQLRSLTHLDLSQDGLERVPAIVFDLPNLKSLDLGKNYDLTSLPADIAKLKNLEFLGLAFTMELKHLPPEIAQLEKLQEISGLSAGFIESPEVAELQKSLKSGRITGKEEGALIDSMQKTEIEAAKIEKEQEAKKKKQP
jgi:Leucine-rich repeat (LRR) protein